MRHNICLLLQQAEEHAAFIVQSKTLTAQHFE
jgi:hypothetical protein